MVDTLSVESVAGRFVLVSFLASKSMLGWYAGESYTSCHCKFFTTKSWKGLRRGRKLFSGKLFSPACSQCLFIYNVRLHLPFSLLFNTEGQGTTCVSYHSSLLWNWDCLGLGQSCKPASMKQNWACYLDLCRGICTKEWLTSQFYIWYVMIKTELELKG